MAQEAASPGMLGRGVQVAWVVKDLDAALTYWTETLKVGPFIVFEGTSGGRRIVHRGREVEVQTSVALTFIGDTQIELVAQHNTGASPYSEFRQGQHEGLHHIAFWPDNPKVVEDQLSAAGHSPYSTVYLADETKNVEYFDSPEHFDVPLELITMNSERRAYFDAIKALAGTWDGTRPVRKFRSRAEFLASDDVKSLPTR